MESVGGISYSITSTCLDKKIPLPLFERRGFSLKKTVKKLNLMTLDFFVSFFYASGKNFCAFRAIITYTTLSAVKKSISYIGFPVDNIGRPIGKGAKL